MIRKCGSQEKYRSW